MTTRIVVSWSFPTDTETVVRLTDTNDAEQPGLTVGLLSFSDSTARGIDRLWQTERVTHDDLIDALSMSQRLGFLGARPIAEVIEHALGFVDAISSLAGHVVDLGAGGGVPGLVLAAQRPDLALTMVDRRTKRTDFLERIVHKYDLGERVEVLGLDVDDLIESSGGTFDVAVARGFGPPLITLRAGTALVRVGGSIVISEPPDGDRWNADDLDRLGVERQPEASGVVRFVRVI